MLTSRSVVYRYKHTMIKALETARGSLLFYNIYEKESILQGHVLRGGSCKYRGHDGNCRPEDSTSELLQSLHACWTDRHRRGNVDSEQREGLVILNGREPRPSRTTRSSCCSLGQLRDPLLSLPDSASCIHHRKRMSSSLPMECVTDTRKTHIVCCS